MDLSGLAYFCKKNYMKFNLLLFALLLFASCNNQTNESTTKEQNVSGQPKEVKIGNRIITKNPLIGTYFGDLPCADCKGIKSILTLGGSNNASYIERKVALGKKENNKLIQGTWSISADSSLVTVTSRSDENDKMYFKREGKDLTLMNSATEPKKCGSENCTLKKAEPQPIQAREAIRKAKEESKGSEGMNGSIQKVESQKK